jgi:hypothetical protein
MPHLGMSPKKARFSQPPHPADASPVMATPLPPEARVFQYAATASPRSAGASPRAAKGFLRLARASPEVAGRLLRAARVLPRLVGTVRPTFFR